MHGYRITPCCSDTTRQEMGFLSVLKQRLPNWSLEHPQAQLVQGPSAMQCPAGLAAGCLCECQGRQQNEGNGWDRGYFPSTLLQPHIPTGTASPSLAPKPSAYLGCGAGTDLHQPQILFLGHTDQECNHAHFLPHLCKEHPPYAYFHCISGLV